MQAADAISAARTVRFSKGLNAFLSAFSRSMARHRFDASEGIRARCSIEISFAPATLPAVIAARSLTSMGDRTLMFRGNEAKEKDAQD